MREQEFSIENVLLPPPFLLFLFCLVVCFMQELIGNLIKIKFFLSWYVMNKIDLVLPNQKKKSKRV